MRYPAEIGHFDLLPRLFETIFIPSVVYEELQHPASPQSVRAVFNPPPAWLRIVVTEVADDDPVLMPLDEGEKAALTLDVTLGADLILKGAAAARVKGLELTTSCEVCSRGTEKNEFF